MRNLRNLRLALLSSTILLAATSFDVGAAQAQTSSPVDRMNSIEAQIRGLQNELRSMRTEAASRDRELRAAQREAAQARQEANRAQQTATARAPQGAARPTAQASARGSGTPDLSASAASSGARCRCRRRPTRCEPAERLDHAGADRARKLQGRWRHHGHPRRLRRGSRHLPQQERSRRYRFELQHRHSVPAIAEQPSDPNSAAPLIRAASRSS